jgi:ribonuclease HI
VAGGHGGEIHAYTDGGAGPNPGPGGWGVVLLRPGAEPVELSGGEEFTTNNRMELTAAIRALEAAGEGARVRLVTDSQYLRRGITSWLPRWAAGGWRRQDGGEVANQDLWRRLAALAASRRVRWEWVRGHAGERWNERADALARAEAAERRRGAAGAGAARAAAEPAAAGGFEPRFDVYLKASGRGGWAARVRRRGAGGSAGAEEAGAEAASELLTGARRGASANELILEAAAAALESLPPGAGAAVHSASDYLRDGAAQWLPIWRRRGWRTQTGGAVANRAAWERLARALAARPVSWPRPDEAAAAEIAALEKAARRAAGEA